MSINNLPGWRESNSHGLYWRRGNFAIVQGDGSYEFCGMRKTTQYFLLVRDPDIQDDKLAWSLDSCHDVPASAAGRATIIEAQGL